jgi:acetyl-CoA synthetase
MRVDDIVWRPRPDDLESSQVARLMRRHGIGSGAELRARAAAEPEWFYPAIMEDLGVEWHAPYHTLKDDSRGLAWTEWFLGGEINVVYNVLDRHLAAGHGDRTALIAEDDEGAVTRLTYAELSQRASRFAGGLRELGVGIGDAIGFYLPMTPEVTVALLACLKIGAVPVPVFAGFGPEALAARLEHCGARVLLTADGTTRRGKASVLKGTADQAADLAGCVRTVVVLRSLGADVPWHEGRDLEWSEVERGDVTPAKTVPLPSDARSLLLYTSGTTGRPKGVVHTHAGVLTVTAKEVGYHLDVRPGDVMFWLTDIGWMMGPWEILGVLFHGGTVVTMNGAPDHPAPDRIWRMVEQHRITHLALAPTAVRLLATHGEEHAEARDLSSLRVLGSTGEPWDLASYQWFFEVAGGARCPIVNISGGTELMGCLLAPLVVEPLKPCSLQGPALGMDVDVFDEDGRSVRGDVGHLVCKRPAPNMTRGFLAEPERYLETYFSRFGETVWAHGDWAIVDGDGYWFLTGRADDTLKIAGKRIGPGEVESAAATHEAVRESAAVGVPDEIKGTRLVLVAVAAPDASSDEETGKAVAKHVAEQMGPAMRPSEVRWVPALPVTRSGKIVRGVIRRVLSGRDPGDLASVANPEAVEPLRS